MVVILSGMLAPPYRGAVFENMVISVIVAGGRGEVRVCSGPWSISKESFSYSSGASWS